TGIFAGGTYAFSGADGLLENDIELNGQPLSISEVSPGIGGTIEVDDNGSFRFRPWPWFQGWDSFTYEVTNGTESTIGNVSIFVGDPVDAESGDTLRPLTEAEIKEQSAPLIETVRVESSNGGDVSPLLGAGRLQGIGLLGLDGHARTGAENFFGGPTDSQITFDLGATQRLETMRLWNDNSNLGSSLGFRTTNRGAKTIEVWGDPDTDGDALADDLTLFQTISLAEAPFRTDYTGQIFDLDSVDARFIQLRILDNHGNASASGLSDVEFRGITVAPEASPQVPFVFIEDVSSDPNPDRRAGSTLGPGYREENNAHNGTVRGTNWESAADDAAPSITYDLKDLYQLGSVRIWNYNHSPSLNRGAKTIEVYASANNVDYELLKTIELERGSGSNSYTGEKFALDSTVARFVRFEITESHGAEGNVGLAEVQFFGDVLEAGAELPIRNASTSNGNGAASIVNVINGSGLDEDNLFHNNASGNRYTSNFNITPTLTFELEQAARINKIHVWNYTAGSESDRGIRQLRLLTSIDGENYEDRGIFMIERGSSQQTFYDAINLQLDPVIASHVRFEVIETWGDANFTGLGEVKFFGDLDFTSPTMSVASLTGGIAVDSIDVLFSEDVTGVEKDDFVLVRGEERLSLVGAEFVQRTPSWYTISGLAALTLLSGEYDLDFASNDVAITDLTGNDAVDLTSPFQVVPVERAYNPKNKQTTLIEHDPAYELDSGKLSVSFQALGRTTGTLVSKDHFGFGEGGHLTLRLNRGKVEVRLQSVDRSYVIRGGSITEGQWHNVEFEFGSAEGMRLFLDGVLVAEDAYVGGLGASSGGTGNREDIAIGGSKIRSTAGENDRIRHDFAGRISDVRLQDATGRVVFAEAQTPVEINLPDNFFDGVDDYFEIDHDERFELESGAIELTFRTDDASITQGLFSKDNRGYDDGGHLTARIVNERVEVRLQSNDQSFRVQSDVIESGREYTMRFEFGDGGMRLWLNGLLVDSNAYSGGIESNLNSFILGANQWGSGASGDRLQDYFQGHLGDFKLEDGLGNEIDTFF
ncbi:MAG: discoidin domain-containing protein, partial [Planctomycetota bacterium]